MATVGFLHTSGVHVATFRSLVADREPDLAVVEVVDEALLGDAQVSGIDDGLRERLRARLLELRDLGSTVVVCTCSTFGALAEQLTDSVAVPVLRIDRPMAERAAAIGGRIAMVVAVSSTLAPTRELLQECIAASPRDATLIEASCLDAWKLFESGDFTGYIDRVAAHARELAHQADVIVLGQASMATAADQLTDLPIPVLCSPSAAVDAALSVAAAASR
jgi:Asp/Glu/hydantoin racemase